jgi:transcriptional regulator with XRE-family HTH domain
MTNSESTEATDAVRVADQKRMMQLGNVIRKARRVLDMEYSNRRRRERYDARPKTKAKRTNKYSLRSCANVLGMSRQKYTEIEQGTSPISVPQLETLAKYLEIPLEDLFPDGLPGVDGPIVTTSVSAEPGQVIHLIVNIPHTRGASVDLYDIESDVLKAELLRRRLQEPDWGRDTVPK